MKQRTAAELRQFLDRLESHKTRVSGHVIEKVRRDYLARLQEQEQCSPDGTECDPALKRMFENLGELMEEILLRVDTGEFTKEDLFSGIIHLNMFSAVNQLMQLFQGLEMFKSSISSLTDETALDVSEVEGTDTLDVNSVLADFDDIDIFAEYQDGDETYDTKYEEEDRWVLNELFLMIMDGYIEPIAAGIRSVLSGNSSGKLFTALLSSLRPLQRSAETMGFGQLADALSQLEDVLNQAVGNGMNAPTRILLIKAYSLLKSNLPDSGRNLGLIDVLDNESTTSSFMLTLINSHKIDEWIIQVLIEAGVNTRRQLQIASPEEISAVTGLSYAKSERILAACREVLTINK